MVAGDGKALVRIERRRAVDDVYQAIRDAILDRRFPPGMRLNAHELASQLGVSLTPCRSAIELLAADGFVDMPSRSVTFVATFSRRDLEETFEIRCALECLASEKAVERINDEQIERTRKLLSGLSRPIQTDAHRQAHEQADAEFHEIIIRSSDNQRLADMYDGLKAHITMCRLHRIDENWQLRLTEEQREHEEIFSALEKRDATAMVSALRAHILRAKDRLLECAEVSE